MTFFLSTHFCLHKYHLWSTGYGVSLAFAPGNRYLIVGTREGRIQAVDSFSGELSVDQEAHEGAVWSIAVNPDGKGLVSGSADKLVKFWEFNVIVISF